MYTISRVAYYHTDISVEASDSSTATMSDSATANNYYERARPTADSEQIVNDPKRKYAIYCDKQVSQFKIPKI